MNLLDATSEFHRLALFPVGEWPIPEGGHTYGRGVPMSEEGYEALRALRRNLMREEVREYFDGEAVGDIVEIVDGLLDIIVIAWGTLLSYVGEELAGAAADEVGRSNLSKVDGSLGEIVRRPDGKVLKPEGWQPPNIRKVLMIGEE